MIAWDDLFFKAWVIFGVVIAIAYWVSLRFQREPPTRLIKGGHCGLCGKWLPDAIVDSRWQWSICEDWETECFNTHSSVTLQSSSRTEASA